MFPAENFSESIAHIAIKNEGKIYSATQDGKIPFVSAEDIAAVAYRALVDEKPHNTDHVILGPELLSYDDVSSIDIVLLDIRGDSYSRLHMCAHTVHTYN